jgi:hypothetical protein
MVFSQGPFGITFAGGAEGGDYGRIFGCPTLFRSARAVTAVPPCVMSVMTEDECLQRFGLSPEPEDVAEIRDLLRQQAAVERESQGCGDTMLMKLLCIQLFSVGDVNDTLAIWNAKTASMDADCSIDVQLLCGDGLAETKTFLTAASSDQSQAALNRILEREAAGDFEDFSREDLLTFYKSYYGI